MNRSVGTRVVRGPDWKWGNQGGDEGIVGTVVAVQSPKVMNVQWDTGIVANYRTGAESSYDLRIFDNAQCGVRHRGVSCLHCNEADLPGMRWQCEVCESVDLCTACYMADQHNVGHTFRRYTTSLSAPASIPTRRASTKRDARGLFPGAVVLRSTGWRWEDQDGGKSSEGELIELLSWSRSTCRDAVRVRWQNGSVFLYRLGHDGKVDVQQKPPNGSGGSYYPEHLPILGKAEQQYASTPTATSSASSLQEGGALRTGDEVIVELDPALLQELQIGHGGWSPAMNEFIGKIGHVQHVALSGDVVVEYEPKKRFTFHPAAVRKAVSS